MSNKIKIVLILSVILITTLIITFYQKEEITPKQLQITQISENNYAFTTLDNHLIQIKENNGSPSISLEKWNNDIHFTLTMPYDITSEAENDGEKLSWNAKTQNPGENREVIFSVLKPTERVENFNGEERTSIQYKNGGVKFDIILQEEPSSNIFEFDIETENLNFYYQPVISEQEMEEEGINRPDNVQGSYAVYHSSKRDNEYKTGKAFHIYRPLIIDAEGNEVWGELNIGENSNKLTITIDEDWLNNASYPVRVDPTFGYTEEGSSFTYYGIDYDIISSQYNCPDNASLISLSIYARSTTITTTEFYIAGIYDTSLNKKDETESMNSPTRFQSLWLTGDFIAGAEITSGNYYLSVTADGAGGSNHIHFDDGGTDQSIISNNESYIGSMPSTLSPDSYQDRKYSIYVTYEPTEEEAEFPNPTETGYFIKREGNQIRLFAPKAETREISIE